jgi:hypothetical protein
MGPRRASSWFASGTIGLACALGLLVAPPARAARWDPVTPAELASTACPFDATAGAEILFWRVWVEDKLQSGDVETIRDNYMRVKIYSAAAAQEWTRHTFTLASSRVRVSGLVARTIQPDGSVVDMDPHSVAKEVTSRVRGEKIKTITFAIPAVKVGSIVEFRVQEAQDDALTEYVEFPLQAELPARSIQYYLRPMALEGWHQRQMVFHAQLLPAKKQDTGFSLLEVSDMRAFRREPHMPPERQVQAWMLVYYSDQRLTTPLKFWREQGIAGAEFFDAFVRADDALRKTAKDIVDGARGPDEQLERLVGWCRREIRVSASSAPESLRAHHISPNKDARAVLRQRAGTHFDLDMLFGALARTVGFEVRYARVPVRSKLYFDQEMMDLRFLQSYDIAVRVGGRWRCYDAQSRRLPWNMLPWDEESQMALFCDRDSTMFLETQMSDPEQNVRARSGELTLDEEGSLEGDVQVEASGHWNALLSEALLEATDSLATVREWMDWKGDWLELSALRVQTRERESEPLRFVVHARIPSHAVRSGKRMLLEPTAWWAHREPEFGASHRDWPVEFPFAWSDVDSLRIRLPKGWKCETISAPRPARAPGVAELKTELRELESGSVLLVRRVFTLGYDGQTVFPATSYGALRKLFALFSESDRTTTPLVSSGE